MRRILLLHNTPKARRYFKTLQANLVDYDIQLAPVGVRGGAQISDEKRREICAYTMKRKHVREHIPDWRLKVHQTLHEKAAGWHYADALASIRRYTPDAIGVWGGQAVDVRAALEAARDAGVPYYVFECGLLPDTTTCDPRGVNFDNSVPRDPAFYRGYDTRVTLPENLVQRAGKRNDAAVALPERYVFVPFQVKLDSQVLLYSPWIRGMDHLYTVMTEAWRDTLADQGIELVFKRHPSCPQQYRPLLRDAAQTDGVRFADGNTTQELIDNALGVLTVNSSVGLDGILRGKPVLTVGDACFAVPGVADSARSVAEVGAWMRRVADGEAPDMSLREPFLHYLAHDYCIPQAHKQPADEHFAAMARRLTTNDHLVSALP